MNKKIFLSPVFLLGLAACSGGSGGGNKALNSSRAMLEPAATFSAQKKTQNFKTLDTSEKIKIFKCEDPSTDTRTEKEKLSMSLQTVSRSKWTLDAPMQMTSVTQAYSTTDGGATFSKSVSIDTYKIGDSAIIPNSGIGYNDVCSRKEGCDEERRTFSAGSPLEMVRLGKQAEIVGAELSAKAVACSFKQDKDIEIDQEMTQGAIELGGQAHNAVSIVITQQGSLYCQTGAENLYMGKATQKSRTIILADEIPNEYLKGTTSQIAAMTSINNIASAPCQRTVVFSGYEVVNNGALISGSSAEIASYLIDGKTQSLEEWEQSKQDQKDTLARLQVAVERAADDVRQARAALRNARVIQQNRKATWENKTSERESAEAKVLVLKGDETATEEQIKAAEKELQAAQLAEAEAKVRYDSASKNVEQAQEAKDIAEKALFDAELELKNFKEKLAGNN